MVKLNRNYSILIENEDGSNITIKPPFTIQFNVRRSDFGSVNMCNLRIFNLSPKSRQQIRRDSWDTIVSDFLQIKRITFKAGYGDNLSVTFKGQIQQAWSVREGVDFITEIIAGDGMYGFANSITNREFPEGTSQSAMIGSIMSDLGQYGIDTGAIGDFGGDINRGASFSGGTAQILSDVTGSGFFVDNQVAYALKDSECLDGPSFIISPKSGLLNTPIRETSFVNFEILFEPTLKIGSLIVLQSFTDNLFNGTYRVKELNHHGMISETVAGSVVTNIQAIKGSFTPVRLSA